MTGLRDQLARKRARTSSFTFAVDEEGVRALDDYRRAERAVELARLTGKNGEQAQAQVDDLKATLREHCQQITFRGLTEDEFDALLSEHTTQGEGDEDGSVDLRGFLADALAACVLDEGNLTAEEWADELASDRWTKGDLQALRERVQSATTEQPALSIPFG